MHADTLPNRVTHNLNKLHAPTKTPHSNTPLTQRAQIRKRLSRHLFAIIKSRTLLTQITPF
ncbi:hypothetical protein DENIT_10388 [Pseudomonas veronii]|nr:hypothetical protein DENIT_10388 [Pseudomonas veronii]